jgi:hypothetical protein
MGKDLFLPSLGVYSERIIMPAQLKVNDLVVGNRYNVFLADSQYNRNMGVKPIPYLTGTFRKIVDGEAVIEKDEKDEKGNPIRGYFLESNYRFEEVPSATANKVVDPAPVPAFKRYPAGNALNAVRALRKTQGARRKTRKHTRRSRKTRRSV